MGFVWDKMCQKLEFNANEGYKIWLQFWVKRLVMLKDDSVNLTALPTSPKGFEGKYLRVFDPDRGTLNFCLKLGVGEG